MRFEPLLAMGIALSLAACATTRADSPAEPVLASSTYATLKPAQVQNLIVIVHADLPEGQPVDYAAFARRAAEAVPGGASVVLMRPGYAGADGATSPGIRNRGIGDGYSADAARQLGRSVQALRARYRHAKIILVGDGGGAVIAANLAAMQPALVDSMMLIGCPCALPEWRKLMARGDRAFAESVDSLDPLQTVGGLASHARVAVVSGGDKARVPARIVRLYAEALALRGIAVDYRQLDADGPALLEDPEITVLLARLAEAAAKSEPRT
jgi:pimeloyl-ACP methyl ester carboxylesterase